MLESARQGYLFLGVKGEEKEEGGGEKGEGEEVEE